MVGTVDISWQSRKNHHFYRKGKLVRDIRTIQWVFDVAWDEPNSKKSEDQLLRSRLVRDRYIRCKFLLSWGSFWENWTIFLPKLSRSILEYLLLGLPLLHINHRHVVKATVWRLGSLWVLSLHGGRSNIRRPLRHCHPATHLPSLPNKNMVLYSFGHRRLLYVLICCRGMIPLGWIPDFIKLNW